jgi:hypothetical protein
MAKWRKKPVVIDAVRFLRIDDEGKTQLNEEAPDWLKAAADLPDGTLGRVAQIPETGSLAIHTLEGVMECSPGDWIIRGIEGEVYPCKPNIFAGSYERVPHLVEQALNASTR